ncbi:DUF1232 domain-containing protein [Bdellovibrio sp. BCCA]|uniref:DUF1232 domain-containing protein n=1 Tax=Bdellovibrio sp. BCCA TaxID=3136281 RepID=UPI0030F05A23
MKVAQLNKLLKETKLSPERLAEYLQISNMTVRRWGKNPGTFQIPAQYEANLYAGILSLSKDGLLSKDHPLVIEAFEFLQTTYIQNSFHRMNVTPDQLGKDSSMDEGIVDLCLNLGQQSDNLDFVNQHSGEIKSFEKKNPNIYKMAQKLWQVVRSDEMQRAQKYIAFGALFYLFFPFDLIPDGLPALGFMDDFGILTVAYNYYVRSR